MLIEFAAALDTRYYAHEIVMRTFILTGARFSLSLWVVLASVWGMSTMPEGGIYAQYPCRDGGGGLRFVRQGSEEYTKNIRHRGSPTPPKAASAQGAVLAPRSLRTTNTPCSPSDLPEGPRSPQPACKDSSTTWTSDSRPASLAAHTTETSAEPADLSTPKAKLLVSDLGQTLASTPDLGAATSIAFLPGGAVQAAAEPVRRAEEARS